MDSRTRTAIVTSLSKRVRGRICPSCRHGLADASVEIEVKTVSVMVGFVCSSCGFKTRSAVPFSSRLMREIETGHVPPPISAEEVRAVREALGTWHGTLTQLIAAR